MDNNILTSYLKKTLFWGAARSVSKGFVRASMVLPFILAALAGLAAFFEWSQLQRQSAWGFWICAAAVLAASGFWPLSDFSLRRRSQRLSRLHPEQFREDELVIAVELAASQKVPSSSLLGAYATNLSQRLSSIPASASWPSGERRAPLAWALCAWLAFGALCAVFSPFRSAVLRVVNPFSSRNIDSLITVSPGDVSVPLGADLDIHVEWRSPNLQSPKIKVKSTSEWVELKPVQFSGREISYVLLRITEPHIYRVEWMGEHSRLYRVRPVKPIDVLSFQIELTPPAYAGSTASRQTSPAIKGLKGTRVRMIVTLSDDAPQARLTLGSGSTLDCKQSGDRRWAVEFLLSESTDYRIDVFKDNSWVSGPDRYEIRILTDGPPSVELISPDQDLVVSEREIMPFVFEAQDDVGLGRVDLEWQFPDSGPHVREIARYGREKTAAFETFSWNVADTGLSAGGFVRVRLVAWDQNTVTGPGRAATPWRTLEVEDFRREHELLERDLAAWRDDVVEALAKANALEQALSQTDPAAAQAAQKSESLTASAQALSQKLDRLVGAMEDDPMADESVLREHQAMAENLKMVTRDALPSADRKIQQQKYAEAKLDVRAAASELEKMVALSETLAKDQNLAQIQQAGDDLSDLADAMNASLLSEADQKKVEAMLADAEKMLSEIAQMIQKNPQDLPEDFVNQAAVKNLDLAQPQSLLEQIRQAMARGDAASALALAKQFQSAVKNMRDQLNKAHDEYQSSSAAEKERSLEAESQKLDALIQKQMSLLGDTQKKNAVLRGKEAEAWKNRVSTEPAAAAAEFDLAKKKIREQDLKSFEPLGAAQKSLQSDSSELQRKFQTLSRESAMLGWPLSQALGAAGESMGRSADRLHEADSENAIAAQEDALEKLMDAQSRLQQAMSAMGEGGEGGSGSSGRSSGLRVMGRRSGSSGGAKSAPVRLPRADEFRPPAAFREDLLKGLKERYPKIYEDVIQKYYKRLTE